MNEGHNGRKFNTGRLKIRMIRRGCLIGWAFITAIGWSGCATSQEQSPLLSLLGIDETIADTVEEGEVYDALALLKRGEAHYIRREYEEAKAEYERFLTLHPLHRMAAFAQYRIGMSSYNSTYTHDRNPAPVAQATAAFRQLILNYPQSPYVEPSQEKVAELIGKEAEQQFYVGEFYYKRKAYPAAIVRFRLSLLKLKEGQDPTQDPTTEKTLYYLGRSLYNLGQTAGAEGVFQRLLSEYPASPYTKRIKEKFPSRSSQDSQSPSVPIVPDS